MPRLPEDYRNAYLALLPNGSAWESERENMSGDVYRLSDARSQEHARLGARIRQLVEESDPLTTTEMIEEWEHFYSIVPPTGATLSDRRLAIYQATLGNKIRTEPPIKQIAASMGYTIEAVNSKTINLFTMNTARMNDRLYNLNYRHLLIIRVLNTTPPSPALEEAIRKVALSHLTIRFVYG